MFSADAKVKKKENTEKYAFMMTKARAGEKN